MNKIVVDLAIYVKLFDKVNYYLTYVKTPSLYNMKSKKRS